MPSGVPICLLAYLYVASEHAIHSHSCPASEAISDPLGNGELMRKELLIDRLRSFYSKADTNNFTVLDFVSAFGSPLEALAYANLFWPDFIEFEGMIFHQSCIEDDQDRARIRAALSKSSSRTQLEQSFNQFLIPDSFFSAHLSTATEQENQFLAEQIVQMWKARLAQLFPGKECVVELQSTKETNEGPTIVVYQG